MNVLKVQKAILIGSYYDDIRFWSDTIQNIIIKKYCGDLSNVSESDKEILSEYEENIRNTILQIDKVKKEMQWDIKK